MLIRNRKILSMSKKDLSTKKKKKKKSLFGVELRRCCHQRDTDAHIVIPQCDVHTEAEEARSQFSQCHMIICCL